MRKQRSVSALLHEALRWDACMHPTVTDLSLVLSAVDKFGREFFQLKLSDQLYSKKATSTVSEYEQGIGLQWARG